MVARVARFLKTSSPAQEIRALERTHSTSTIANPLTYLCLTSTNAYIPSAPKDGSQTNRNLVPPQSPFSPFPTRKTRASHTTSGEPRLEKSFKEVLALLTARPR